MSVEGDEEIFFAIVAVEIHADRLSPRRVPIFAAHSLTVVPVPADFVRRELTFSKDWVFLSQRNELGDEREKIVIAMFPIQPRDLTVVTVRIVVTLLRSSQFVARQQHRNTLRQHHRRK